MYRSGLGYIDVSSIVSAHLFMYAVRVEDRRPPSREEPTVEPTQPPHTTRQPTHTACRVAARIASQPRGRPTGSIQLKRIANPDIEHMRPCCMPSVAMRRRTPIPHPDPHAHGHAHGRCTCAFAGHCGHRRYRHTWTLMYRSAWQKSCAREKGASRLARYTSSSFSRDAGEAALVISGRLPRSDAPPLGLSRACSLAKPSLEKPPRLCVSAEALCFSAAI